MEAKDRQLMRATAKGIFALLRIYTEKFSPPSAGVLSGAQKAQDELKDTLAGHTVHSTIPEQSPEDIRSVRVKALGKIRSSFNEGSTCDEIAARYNLPHQSVSARVSELANEQLIVDSGRKRETRSGGMGTVWVNAISDLFTKPWRKEK